MGSYNQFCRHCNQLIPGDAEVCPICQRGNPIMARCPKCHAPIRRNFRSCSHCGQSLEIPCPSCGKATFFDDRCQHCLSSLTAECSNPKCRLIQPILGASCRQCGKPLTIRKEK